MRIYAEKLAESLHKTLYPIYLVFGNEPLLIQEAKTAIEKAAQTQGFLEKHRFSADAGLDWSSVYDCYQALSLFSSRQLIEIEIPESGINTQTAKELSSLSGQLHQDIILLVIGPKLTKAQENAAWLKTLAQQACWVNCLTPELSRLPQFVQQRCFSLGLKPDAEAVQMLAQWHEGNLFALAQSLEKLALLYPDGQLTLVRLEESLSRHNHFTPYHWMDALLEGKANRAQRILRQLMLEESEPIILIRTAQKELTQLLKWQQERQHTATLGHLFDRYRVWQNRRPLYSAALQRLPMVMLSRLIGLLTQAELLAKTQYEQPVWPILQQLSLECCNPQANLPLPQ
ncbi:DNA polymerase III subunit delta [Vibrio sp. AH4]|uniref:DNA polymerase III subunit delta n=1 Tax=Vibrio sp. AH4 TaxID=2919577 RepID=UPI0027399D3C|nr:DNA polymerase III subunit delta [Vibrio sp. AH4]MDP4492403.1 DNA polymerase III subunit delta [Vibrio sp. AH4]